MNEFGIALQHPAFIWGMTAIGLLAALYALFYYRKKMLITDPNSKYKSYKETSKVYLAHLLGTLIVMLGISIILSTSKHENFGDIYFGFSPYSSLTNSVSRLTGVENLGFTLFVINIFFYTSLMLVLLITKQKLKPMYVFSIITAWSLTGVIEPLSNLLAPAISNVPVWTLPFLYILGQIILTIGSAAIVHAGLLTGSYSCISISISKITKKKWLTLGRIFRISDLTVMMAAIILIISSGNINRLFEFIGIATLLTALIAGPSIAKLLQIYQKWFPIEWNVKELNKD